MENDKYCTTCVAYIHSHSLSLSVCGLVRLRCHIEPALEIAEQSQSSKSMNIHFKKYSFAILAQRRSGQCTQWSPGATRSA